MSYYFSDDDETIIVRGCGFGTDNDETNCKNSILEDEDSNFDGTITECRVCDTDHCNSATKAFGAFILLFVSVIINL